MSGVPRATIERQPRRSSLLWIAPVLALAGLTAFLFVQVRAEHGPRIVITFTDAAGLKPGAELMLRGLHVGVVRRVELDSDLKTVLVRAELEPHAAGLASAGTKFWIVRPEVSLSRVTGLETLLGPRYIAVRPDEAPGAAPGKRARRFVGLTEPVHGLEDSERIGFSIRLLARSPVISRSYVCGILVRIALRFDNDRRI